MTDPPVTCEECVRRLSPWHDETPETADPHKWYEIVGPMLSVADGCAMFQSVKWPDEKDEGVLSLCVAWPIGS